MLGLISAAEGLGMASGPFIGTLLFQFCGYNGMLYCFGGLFLVITCMLPFVLPTYVDFNSLAAYHGESLQRYEMSTLDSQSNDLKSPDLAD